MRVSLMCCLCLLASHDTHPAAALLLLLPQVEMREMTLSPTPCASCAYYAAVSSVNAHVRSGGDAGDGL
jgi:hypothetical protein